jgi:Gram-negative bacterial TonB protein C-terminal
LFPAGHMFTQLESANARRQRWLLLGSLAAHGLALAWLLHAPEPMQLNPVSVALGQNGKSLTRLFWASKSRDDSTHSSSDSATERYHHQRLGHEKLTWKAATQLAKLSPQIPLSRADAEDNSKTQTLAALGHGTQAGLPYGTLTRGQLYGDEIRPALPVATSDPVVYPWQLPASPGNEVIEITIDERGEIVSKTVLQSLGPDIDSKCLAALDNWRFQPATRNGEPIPSKQDAIFPFKARG